MKFFLFSFVIFFSAIFAQTNIEEQLEKAYKLRNPKIVLKKLEAEKNIESILLKISQNYKKSFGVRAMAIKALKIIEISKANKIVLTQTNMEELLKEASKLRDQELILKRLKAEKKTVDALLEILQNVKKSYKIRAMAAKALGVIKAYRAVEGLINVLKENNNTLDRAAIGALGQMGKKATKAIPVLIDKMKSKNHHIRSDTAFALGSMVTSPSSPVIPVLLQALADPNRVVAIGAAVGIRKWGPYATNFIPLLMKSLKEGETPYRYNVQKVLLSIGEPVIPFFIKEFKQGTDKTKNDILYIMEKIEVKNIETLSYFGEYIQKNKNHKMAVGVMVTLKYIGPKTATIVARALFNKSSKRIRSFAAYTLKGMGPAAAKAIPALQHALKDPDFGVRISAADALKVIKK